MRAAASVTPPAAVTPIARVGPCRKYGLLENNIRISARQNKDAAAVTTASRVAIGAPRARRQIGNKMLDEIGRGHHRLILAEIVASAR